jgi:bifunctional DNase/RNase
VHGTSKWSDERLALSLRPGDAVGLALLMRAPILVSDELLDRWGTTLAEGETPELAFAHHLL